MNVVRAGRAGFCMGVALALRKLDMVVGSRGGGNVATLGEIIHNPQVLQSYADKGVSCLGSADEAGEGMSVLIRAHGVPRDAEARLRKRCAFVEDATCPRVKKAQESIAEATSGGSLLLLYGEAMHPEVRGLISYARGGSVIFSTMQELEAVLAGREVQEARGKRRNAVFAAQTTQDRLIFDEMRSRLSAFFGPSLVVLDTICDATRERQEEALDIAGRVQAMVVVGGRSSGNTKRLAELARTRGIPAVLVETAAELDADFFHGFSTVGLTAGASTPRHIIDEVERALLSMPGRP